MHYNSLIADKNPPIEIFTEIEFEETQSLH